MRVHSSLQKYENEDIVMCNICFSPRIFCFSLPQGVGISFGRYYLCYETQQIYESGIYKLFFSSVFIRCSSCF